MATKFLATLILAATSLLAETVHFTPTGKTYHASEQCATLARSKTKLHADRAEAEKHGLKPCGWCHRGKKTGAPKSLKNAWAVQK